MVAGASLLVGKLAVGLHGLEGLEALGSVDGAAHDSADPHNLNKRQNKRHNEIRSNETRLLTPTTHKIAQPAQPAQLTLARADPDMVLLTEFVNQISKKEA